MESWRKLLEEHPGKVFGALGGVLFGFLVFFLGPFWAVFIVACGVAGFLLGKRLEENEGDLSGIWDDLVSRDRE